MNEENFPLNNHDDEQGQDDNDYPVNESNGEAGTNGHGGHKNSNGNSGHGDGRGNLPPDEEDNNPEDDDDSNDDNDDDDDEDDDDFFSPLNRLVGKGEGKTNEKMGRLAEKTRLKFETLVNQNKILVEADTEKLLNKLFNRASYHQDLPGVIQLYIRSQALFLRSGLHVLWQQYAKSWIGAIDRYLSDVNETTSNRLLLSLRYCLLELGAVFNRYTHTQNQFETIQELLLTLEFDELSLLTQITYLNAILTSDFPDKAYVKSKLMSLWEEAKADPDDYIRLRACILIGRFYYLHEPDEIEKAFGYAQQAFIWASFGNNPDMATATSMLALCFAIAKEIPSPNSHYLETVATYWQMIREKYKIDSVPNTALFDGYMGYVYQSKGLLKEGIHSYAQSYVAYQKMKDLHNQGLTALALAWCYTHLNIHHIALAFCDRAADHFTQLNDEVNLRKVEEMREFIEKRRNNGHKK